MCFYPFKVLLGFRSLDQSHLTLLCLTLPSDCPLSRTTDRKDYPLQLSSDSFLSQFEFKLARTLLTSYLRFQPAKFENEQKQKFAIGQVKLYSEDH